MTDDDHEVLERCDSIWHVRKPRADKCPECGATEFDPDKAAQWR